MKFEYRHILPTEYLERAEVSTSNHFPSSIEFREPVGRDNFHGIFVSIYTSLSSDNDGRKRLMQISDSKLLEFKLSWFAEPGCVAVARVNDYEEYAGLILSIYDNCEWVRRSLNDRETENIVRLREEMSRQRVHADDGGHSGPHVMHTGERAHDAGSHGIGRIHSAREAQNEDNTLAQRVIAEVERVVGVLSPSQVVPRHAMSMSIFYLNGYIMIVPLGAEPRFGTYLGIALINNRIKGILIDSRNGNVFAVADGIAYSLCQSQALREEVSHFLLDDIGYSLYQYINEVILEQFPYSERVARSAVLTHCSRGYASFAFEGISAIGVGWSLPVPEEVRGIHVNLVTGEAILLTCDDAIPIAGGDCDIGGELLSDLLMMTIECRNRDYLKREAGVRVGQ